MRIILLRDVVGAPGSWLLFFSLEFSMMSVLRTKIPWMPLLPETTAEMMETKRTRLGSMSLT